TRAQRIHDGLSLESVRIDLDIDRLPGLSDLVQVDTAICGRLDVRRPDASQELNRVRSGCDSTVVAAIPYFDAVQLRFDRTHHVDGANGRMGQHRDAPGRMNTFDELLHRRRANTLRDAVAEDMDAAAFKRELESGYD